MPTSTPEYFPIFLRLDGERVLIVGGGEVAARKIRLLLKAKPRIEVIARELNEELTALVANGAISHLGERFDDPQVVGSRLVIAATDDSALNQRVSAAAQAAGIPVNA